MLTSFALPTYKLQYYCKIIYLQQNREKCLPTNLQFFHKKYGRSYNPKQRKSTAYISCHPPLKRSLKFQNCVIRSINGLKIVFNIYEYAMFIMESSMKRKIAG